MPRRGGSGATRPASGSRPRAASACRYARRRRRSSAADPAPRVTAAPVGRARPRMRNRWPPACGGCARPRRRRRAAARRRRGSTWPARRSGRRSGRVARGIRGTSGHCAAAEPCTWSVHRCPADALQVEPFVPSHDEHPVHVILITVSFAFAIVRDCENQTGGHPWPHSSTTHDKRAPAFAMTPTTAPAPRRTAPRIALILAMTLAFVLLTSLLDGGKGVLPLRLLDQ